jgi:hypothetical protein
VDWNGDGRDDLIVGDGWGRVNWFARLPDGTLTEMPDIRAAGEVIDVGYISAPVVVDWNGDGLKDLLVGREFTDGGSTRLYLNEGSPEDPQLADPIALESSGEALFHWRTGPQLGDMDGDGLRDLVIAGGEYGPFYQGGGAISFRAGADEHWGWVHFYRNTGTNQQPVFEDSVRLCAEGQPIYRDHHNICLYDYNGDSRLDILSGDYDGQLLLYLAQPSAAETADSAAAHSELVSVSGSPSSGSFALRISAPAPGRYRAVLLSADGRVRRTLLDEQLPTGISVRSASATGLPAGAYLVSCTGAAGRWGADRLVVAP